MLMMNAPAGLAAAAAAQAAPPAAPAPLDASQGVAPAAPAVPHGVAPFAPAAPVSPASAAAKAKLKGTMLGVAPPSPGAAPAPPFGTPLGGPPGGISPGAGFPAPAPVAGVPTPVASPPAAAPVNPLGGTMVADASSFGSPGAYGSAPGAQPAWGAPPAQGYGTPPQQPVYSPPAQGYAAPPAHADPSGYAPPTQAEAGGYGAPPAYGSPPQYQSGALSPYGADPLAPTSPGGHGPVGKIRNPVNDMIFGAVCGFYALYVWIMGVLELKAFRQKSDISLILLFIPIVQLFVIWSLTAKMLDAKQLAGIPGARVGHPIMYLIPIYGLYCFIVDLNEVFQAASGSQSHYG